jgi:putative two-component system response regulator
MTGFEAMGKLKDDGLAVPVIFLTGMTDAKSEAYGIELGAVDFIVKPFSRVVLLNRINNHLNIDELIRERTEQLVKRTEQLERLQNGIIDTMADLVESRDKNTGGHIERTAAYMEILTGTLLGVELYADEILGWNIKSVASAARLHDVGKIAIPDSILNKPGSLTKEEFDIIQTHTSEGAHIIDKVIKKTGDAEFLQHAKMFATYHHERWSGNGYPYGLKGTEIPLQGRLMAIIDVYDALVSERPYKKGFTQEESVSISLEEAGRHFDPIIAEAFKSINERIKELSEAVSNGIKYF